MFLHWMGVQQSNFTQSNKSVQEFFFWCGTTNTPSPLITIDFFAANMSLCARVCVSVCARWRVCVQVETRGSKHSLFIHSCVKQQLRDASLWRPEARRQLQRTTACVTADVSDSQASINRSVKALSAVLDSLIIFKSVSDFLQIFILIRRGFKWVDRINTPKYLTCFTEFYWAGNLVLYMAVLQ